MLKINMRTALAGIAAAITLACIPLPLSAAEEPKTEILTPQQAVEAAQEKAAGTLTGLSLGADDGAAVYGIEIMDSKGYKIDCEVDALTGQVRLDRDDDKVYSYQQVKSVKVDWQTALETAMADLEGSTLEELELERSWSQMVYNIELIDTAGYEHKVRVDADTGKVLSTTKATFPAGVAAKVSAEKAGNAALKAIGGGVVLKSKLDYERHTLYFDVLAMDDSGQVWELEIDAGTGAVLRQQWDD